MDNRILRACYLLHMYSRSIEFSQLVCDFNVDFCTSSLGIIRRNALIGFMTVLMVVNDCVFSLGLVSVYLLIVCLFISLYNLL